LSGKGFFVLQLPDPEDTFWDTTEEAPRAMAAYEGAVTYLDRKGLIDTSRVGIVGFSRTCFYLAYTLTHSKLRFRAASISDGGDGSYFQYMIIF
jgi:dienelactone hydrolase